MAMGVAVGVQVVASRMAPPEVATSSSGKDFGGEGFDADPGDDDALLVVDSEPMLRIDGFISSASTAEGDALGDDDGEPSADGTGTTGTGTSLELDPVTVVGFGGDPLAPPLLPLLLPPGLMRPSIFLRDLVPEKRCLLLATAARRSARVFLLALEEGVFLLLVLVADEGVSLLVTDEGVFLPVLPPSPLHLLLLLLLLLLPLLLPLPALAAALLVVGGVEQISIGAVTVFLARNTISPSSDESSPSSVAYGSAPAPPAPPYEYSAHREPSESAASPGDLPMSSS
mmetsp:Transcript_34994/g.75805  ORF Transcript_34994/g.75805 Transcript_34994/m.75805 type:complete len:285 (-) Transcript_34994:291-1145(-)